MLDLKVYPKVHNRFDVYKKNVETGEEKQVGYAENIVLDQMWTRLCGGSTYFVNIHYGTGSGPLSAARDSLFTHLGTAAAADVEKVRAVPTSSWRRSIVLGLSTANGSNLSELGIAYGNGTNNLVTHAMIRDMNGNVIIIPKTSLDIITIYATVYITLDNSDANLKLLHPDVNGLINYLLGGSFPSAVFSAGESRYSADWPRGLVSQSLGNSAIGSWSADVVNKRRSTSLIRFNTAQGNGNIGEILASTIARLALPATGIYAGLDLVGVPVGTGDGIADTFYLPSANARMSSIEMKVDGAPETGLTKSAHPRYIAIKHPDGAPTNASVNCCEISDNGEMMVIGYSSTPYVSTYRQSEGAWIINTIPPSVINGQTLGCALSEDGLVLAICQNGTGYIRAYDWVNNLWVIRPQPPNAPNAQPNGCALSADGSVLVVVFIASPYIRSYDWVDGAWVMRAQVSSPSTNPTGVSLSGDGLVMAISHTGSPYISTYDWSGTAWIARAQPAELPSTTGQNCALSKSGSTLAVALESSPYVKVYDWSGSAWIARSQPSQVTGVVRDVSLSQDGARLIVGRSTSPFLICLDWINEEWIRPILFSQSLYDTKGCDITADKSRVVSSGFNSIPYFITYSLDNSDTKIVFNSPPGLVTAEPVGTGDGSEVNFALDYTPTGGTLTVKLNGVTTTDYTLAGSTITFNTAPGAGVAITADYKYASVITADYTVDGIHKTAQRVIDCQFTIQFGEPA